MAKEKNESVNFCRRWRPDFRYRDDKNLDCSLKPAIDVTNSITDKESYRLTLASLRGELARGSGSPTVGSYSIPAGQDYDPNKDFSFLNRPGLTIVEIQDYIDNFRSNLEKYDAELKIKVEDEINKAEAKKKELETVQQTKDSKTE